PCPGTGRDAGRSAGRARTRARRGRASRRAETGRADVPQAPALNPQPPARQRKVAAWVLKPGEPSCDTIPRLSQDPADYRNQASMGELAKEILPVNIE